MHLSSPLKAPHALFQPLDTSLVLVNVTVTTNEFASSLSDNCLDLLIYL